MSKKLSIITVNLNNSTGLLKTIKSVVSQTFSDYEYIIIDGGSTDGSVDIIKQYADKITYWVSEPDKGIYNAMNKGILQAKGEYCLFLNSGDYLYSKDVLYNVFIVNYCKEDIITGNSFPIYPNQPTKLSKGRAYDRKQKGESLTLYDMYKGTINHCSSFIKRKLFDKYGLYDENYKIVSDWIFFLKVIGLYGIQVEYADVIISCFDKTGISSCNRKLLEIEREKALESCIPHSILADYSYFDKLESKFKRSFRYRFVNKLTQLINRFS